jgi:hypothetical protein
VIANSKHLTSESIRSSRKLLVGSTQFQKQGLGKIKTECNHTPQICIECLQRCTGRTRQRSNGWRLREQTCLTARRSLKSRSKTGQRATRRGGRGGDRCCQGRRRQSLTPDVQRASPSPSDRNRSCGIPKQPRPLRPSHNRSRRRSPRRGYNQAKMSLTFNLVTLHRLDLPMEVPKPKPAASSAASVDAKTDHRNNDVPTPGRQRVIISSRFDWSIRRPRRPERHRSSCR